MHDKAKYFRWLTVALVSCILTTCVYAADGDAHHLFDFTAVR